MTYTTLISPAQLQTLLDQKTPCMVFDCSFDLTDPSAGEAMFRDCHIANAVYVHLDYALSAKGALAAAGAMSGGRHPLPTREAFVDWLTQRGFTNAMQAVVYDRQGANYCGRLWWMLKWLGHASVAVLDGGLQAWQTQGGAVSSGVEGNASPAQGQNKFALKEPLVKLVTVSELEQQLRNSNPTVLDARGAPRFRGEV